MPGKGAFKRCVEKVRAKGRASSPAGVCAAAGRKKYGAAEFERMAKAGKKRAARKPAKRGRRNLPLDPFTVSALPGTIKLIDKERRSLGRKLTKKAGKKTRKNKGRANPIESARERYARFHGRASGEDLQIRTPIHEHSVLAALGYLRKLVVITVGAGHKVTISNFGKSKTGAPCILAMNEDATQLFIDGGDQSVNLSDFGIFEPYHERETLGRVEYVYYFTTKDHLAPEDGGEATYKHKFGGVREIKTARGKRKRVRSALPDLIYDVRNKLLEFSGGGYTIPDEGIAN
jgi:hypothetical protein